jgi:hypothetical protein
VSIRIGVIRIPTPETQRKWDAIDACRKRRVDTFRLEYDRWSQTIHRGGDEQLNLFADGAAEAVIARHVREAEEIIIATDDTLRESKQLIRESNAMLAAFDKGERRWRRAAWILDGFASVLPARVVNEDLGDYVEDVNHRCVRGQRLLVWLRVATAIGWTAVNTVGYALKALGKRQAG